jgi:hypothetical protein
MIRRPLLKDSGKQNALGSPGAFFLTKEHPAVALGVSLHSRLLITG